MCFLKRLRAMSRQGSVSEILVTETTMVTEVVFIEHDLC